MSQSDYIKYKKVKNELQINNQPVVAKKYIPKRIQNVYFKPPPIYDTSDYTDFKEYTLENTIVNTKPVLNRVTPTGKQVVLGMDKTITPNCAKFILCNNTNTRPNRQLNTIGIRSNGISSTKNCQITVTPVPLNINIMENSNNIKNSCNCAINRSYSQKYLCQCKKAHYYSS